MIETKSDKSVLGHLSQKHESLAGNPIEDTTSAEINREARGTLMSFVNDIRTHLQLFQKIPLERYNDWAKVSHDLLDHSPASLYEVFPISKDRHIDVILNSIKYSNSEIGTFLQQSFENSKGRRKKDRARKAMAELQANMDRFAGKILSEDDFQVLSKFQDMVERFESPRNIARLNNHPKIREILELVMSVQYFLCEVLEEKRKNEPDWFKENEAVFGEIALFDGAQIVPSSRFLKLILHNVGEYIVREDKDKTSLEILKGAFKKAVDAKIFHQKICIFRKTNKGIVFESVKDKVCPASGFLANLVLNEIS